VTLIMIISIEFVENCSSSSYVDIIYVGFHSECVSILRNVSIYLTMSFTL